MSSPQGLCRLAPVRFDRADWPAAVVLDVQPYRPDPEPSQMELTARQQAILDFIRAYLEEAGFSPSFREIAAAVGLKSQNSAAYQVGELRRLGVLAEADEARRPRALRLVRGGDVA